MNTTFFLQICLHLYGTRRLVALVNNDVLLCFVSLQYGNPDAQKMLIGSKCDMEDYRKVPRQSGESVSVLGFSFCHSESQLCNLVMRLLVTSRWLLAFRLGHCYALVLLVFLYLPHYNVNYFTIIFACWLRFDLLFMIYLQYTLCHKHIHVTVYPETLLL